MIDQSLYLKLFANCIPVKGLVRAVICDTQRRKLDFIPNSLYDLLIEEEDQSIQQIIAAYGADNQATILDYINFLLDKEYAFLCTAEELSFFPSFEKSWDSPSLIENAIIDISTNSHHQYSSIFTQLEQLGCMALQLRYYDSIRPATLFELLHLLDKSSIQNVEILLKHSSEWTQEALQQLSHQFVRVNEVILHSCPKEELYLSFQARFALHCTTKIIDGPIHCGVISPNYFRVNLSTILESKKHNNCLNRKISIDQDGAIKNCPSLAAVYGNIKDTSLRQALQQESFKEYWDITKDQIAGCKSCEFRYICTDCRAYVDTPGDQYAKPLKCGYSPATATWEEWSSNELKDSAMKHYGMEELVKNALIKER